MAHRVRRRWLAWLSALLTAWCCPPLLADSLPRPAPTAAQQQALQRAAAAVVGIEAQAVDGARSAATLGRARAGSGVVIADDGLVATIGYLILEADQVQIVTDDERRIPARVVAYDVASGFGLVRALAPLRLAPVNLGEPARHDQNEPLMVVNGGDEGRVGAARLVSRRGFSGYWEYHVDGALFTSPPIPHHSGAGLFNARGELLGIGSLFVTDAAGAQAPRMAGNMFVPVDLLRASLPEMLSAGRSKSSERAWMGLNCVVHEGRIRVVRVNPDSPADAAGVEVGDEVVAIDGQAVDSLEQLWKQLWRGPRAERTVLLDIQRGGRVEKLTVHAVDREKTLRRPAGV